MPIISNLEFQDRNDRPMFLYYTSIAGEVIALDLYSAYPSFKVEEKFFAWGLR